MSKDDIYTLGEVMQQAQHAGASCELNSGVLFFWFSFSEVHIAADVIVNMVTCHPLKVVDAYLAKCKEKNNFTY